MKIINGIISDDVLSVVLATGNDENGYWEFRCTPMFAHCWAAAKAYAEKHFGKTIYIRTGWNIFRPLAIQIQARKNACAAGNCRGAALPGYSSHGGEWEGRPCLAVDVDPNGLGWDQVDEAMESAGFSAGLITPAISGFPGGEPWHYILFTAFNPVPALANTVTTDPEGLDMNPGTVINVISAYGQGNASKDINGTLFIAKAGGGFAKYEKPFDTNVRGIIGKLQYGGDGEEQDLIPTFSADDFKVIDRLWYLANGKNAQGIKL